MGRKYSDGFQGRDGEKKGEYYFTAGILVLQDEKCSVKDGDEGCTRIRMYLMLWN